MQKRGCNDEPCSGIYSSPGSSLSFLVIGYFTAIKKTLTQLIHVNPSIGEGWGLSFKCISDQLDVSQRSLIMSQKQLIIPSMFLTWLIFLYQGQQYN